MQTFAVVALPVGSSAGVDIRRMSNQPAPELVTVPTAARMIGVHPDSYRRGVAEGRFPGAWIGGRIMVARAVIEDLIRRAGVCNTDHGAPAPTTTNTDGGRARRRRKDS